MWEQWETLKNFDGEVQCEEKEGYMVALQVDSWQRVAKYGKFYKNDHPGRRIRNRRVWRGRTKESKGG